MQPKPTNPGARKKPKISVKPENFKTDELKPEDIKTEEKDVNSQQIIEKF